MTRKIVPLIISILFLCTACLDGTEFYKKDSNISDSKTAEENLKEGQDFLAENAKKEGVITLKTGLQYKVITEGTGESPVFEDQVVCDYEGRLIDGTIFDSSYKRGETAEFPVAGVIPGWTAALQLMKTGCKWELYVPSNLAYGNRDVTGIGPNKTLIFIIELHSIK